MTYNYSNIVSNYPLVPIKEIVFPQPNAIKIGPFGSQLKKEDLSREGYKVYGQENVIANDFLVGDRRISESKFLSLSSCRLFPGDLVLTMMGTIGKCAIFPVDAEIGIMDSHLLRIQTDPCIMNAKFLAIIISAEKMVGRQIERMSHGSIMSGLSSSIVRRLKVPLPPLLEQDRITNILDAIDEQIQYAERIIAKLKLQRESLLHKLLTCGIDEQGQLRTSSTYYRISQKIEIKNFPKKWKIYPLGKIAEIGSGLTLGKKVSGADTIELPYLRVANVQDGYLDLSDMKTIRIAQDDIHRYLLQPGDVLMTEGGDFDKLGRGTVWNGQISPCLHQNHIFRVRPDKDLLLPEFLTMISSSSYGKRFLLLSSKQSTNLASINSTQLKSFPIPCPSITEQERILDVLSKYNKNVNIEEVYLNKLRLYKTSLMHDLLTGKVRIGEQQEEKANISQMCE